MSIVIPPDFQDRFLEALKKVHVPYDKITPSIKIAEQFLQEANPGAPLPDSFFDLNKNTEIIARRMRTTKAEVIRNFPDCVRDLFEGFDLLPEQDATDNEPHDEATSKNRKERKQYSPRVKKLPVGIEDVVDAGKAYFAKHGKRPNANSGPITDGKFAGKMSWSTLMMNCSLDLREGFNTINEIMDFHAIGIRSVEKKMSSAFHSAFDNAAAYLSSSQQNLPYIFKVIEKSLAHTIAKSGAYSNNTVITAELLSPLQLTIADMDKHFRAAASKDGQFPYKSASDFIIKRKIPDQARTIMRNKADDNGCHI